MLFRTKLHEYLSNSVRVLRVLLGHRAEATLLEDADRPDVVDCDPRMERTNRLEHEELRERLCRDALAPVLATHPIGDETLAVLFPTADVPSDQAASDDGAGHVLGAENLRAPVGEEGNPFPRRECGHAQRD